MIQELAELLLKDGDVLDGALSVLPVHLDRNALKSVWYFVKGRQWRTLDDSLEEVNCFARYLI